MKIRTTIFFVFLFCTASFSQEIPQGDYWVCPKKSKLSYQVTHPFHKVIATTHEIEGRALTTSSQGDIMIRVPVASFNSENSNRDAHMKEVVEVHQFPYVEFRGTIHSDKIEKGNVQGKILFHGVEKEIATKVSVDKIGDQLQTKISFQISLESFKINRPSLLFVKIEDEAKIEGDFTFVKSENRATCK